MFVVRTINQ